MLAGSDCITATFNPPPPPLRTALDTKIRTLNMASLILLVDEAQMRLFRITRANATFVVTNLPLPVFLGSVGRVASSAPPNPTST